MKRSRYRNRALADLPGIDRATIWEPEPATVISGHDRNAMITTHRRDVDLAATPLRAFNAALHALAILVIAVFAKTGVKIYAPQLSLTGFTFNGLFLGLVLSIFANIGFESSTALGEEAKNPLRTIPRAVLGAVTISAVFYIFSSFAILGSFSASHATLDGNADVLKTMSSYIGAAWAAPMLTVLVLASAIACTLGSFTPARACCSRWDVMGSCTRPSEKRMM